MKKVFLSVTLTLTLAAAFAGVYMTRTGRVTFFSATPVENIEGINNEMACSLNTKTGDFSFIVPIKSFKFQKALMYEHFNNNYLESDKYPKAEFRGKIKNPGAILKDSVGSELVEASGKLTIHGVTRNETVRGTLLLENGVLIAEAKFTVKCADYGVKIPSVVASKIAEEIQVTVKAPMTLVR